MKKAKILAGIITLGVMLMLIISGPVNAFDLKLTANKDTVTKGSSIKFTVSVDIKSNERLDIDYLKLIIDGPTSKTCKFSVDGEKISGCSGITKIKLIQNTATYGYGYGYGYGGGYTDGKLVYKITLDTDKYSKGDYETKLQISVDGKTTLQDGPDFEIKKKSEKKPKVIVAGTVGVQRELGLNLLELKEGEEYNFIYNSIPNKLVIDKIEGTDISLSVNRISFKIALRETKQIDLDSDGINDMEIKSLFIGDKTSTIFYEGLTGTIVFKEKEETEPIELTNGREDTPPKKEEVSEKNGKVDYQLNNFGIIWLLVLVNLIMLESVGIVKICLKNI